MVSSCSAFGCKNRYNKDNKSVQFHRFPLKKLELLQKWVHEMRRKNFKPSKYSYLCSDHFVPNDYQVRPGASVRWLRDDAVPSIFMVFPDDEKKRGRSKKKSAKLDVRKDVSSQVTWPTTTRQCQTTIVMENKSTQCAIVTSTTILSLRKKVKILQQSLKRRELKFTSLKQLLKIIKRHSTSSINQ